MTTTKIDSTKDWTDKEWNKFDTWIRQLLTDTTVTITYMQKDGTVHTMNCTLKKDMLPTYETKRKLVEMAKPKEYVAVYDIDARDWRSFVIKNVKAFEFTMS